MTLGARDTIRRGGLERVKRDARVVDEGFVLGGCDPGKSGQEEQDAGGADISSLPGPATSEISGEPGTKVFPDVDVGVENPLGCSPW